METGSKKGSGGIASEQDFKLQQNKRLNELFNISKDPYFIKNNLGKYECILCNTLHTSNESYLNHINGKKHQLNLLRREEKQEIVGKSIDIIKNDYVKTGIPSYNITKIKDEDKFGLFIKIKYDLSNEEPIYRIMSCFEYEKDLEKNSNYQYLLIYSKPYEIITFKIPSKEFDKFWTYYDKDIKEYYLQFTYKS